MARPLRIEFPGALYHVISRGNARQMIFLDDQDRDRFLALLDRTCQRFGWRVHAYCLMGNHYHLLLETPRAGLARGMQQLGSGYAQSFNLRHRRVGHVLQGRYKAIIVERVTHLLELARYIVLNPVRAGLCTGADQWRWSSYRATAGITPAPGWLTVDWLLGQFANRPTVARERYRDFVQQRDGTNLPAPSHGRLYAGRDEFVRRILPAVEDTIEIVQHERDPLATRLRAALRDDQAKAILAAYREQGYRLREIAGALGVHPSTVSRRLRQAEAALATQGLTPFDLQRKV